MFREMRRFKQQIPNEECIEILKNEPRGVLSVLGDDGYPYGVPLDHWYSESDGLITIVRYNEMSSKTREWLNRIIRDEYEKAIDHPEYKYFLKGNFPEIIL